MRWGTLFVLGLILSGCAAKPAQPVAIEPPEPVYDDAVAAALVYDPPVLVESPQVQVSRENRGQSAYAGFEEITVTSYFLWQDDRQLNYGLRGRDRFERQAITTKTGVSYR